MAPHTCILLRTRKNSILQNEAKQPCLLTQLQILPMTTSILHSIHITMRYDVKQSNPYAFFGTMFLKLYLHFPCITQKLFSFHHDSAKC